MCKGRGLCITRCELGSHPRVCLLQILDLLWQGPWGRIVGCHTARIRKAFRAVPWQSLRFPGLPKGCTLAKAFAVMFDVSGGPELCSAHSHTGRRQPQITPADDRLLQSNTSLRVNIWSDASSTNGPYVSAAEFTLHPLSQPLPNFSSPQTHPESWKYFLWNF